MPLDPAAKAILEPIAALPLDFATIQPDVLRAAFTSIGPEAPAQDITRVENRTIPGPAGDLAVRIYTPEGKGPHPGLVFFHGGGFVICSLDTHDGACRALANGAGCVVVSVDYRLAPEAKFPAAPEDCYAAIRWVADHGHEIGIDTSRIAVAGDSAGGNLAAVVSLMARERGGPQLRHQLLIYPVTNFAFDTPSYEENAEGYLLTRDMMKWFWQHYLERPGDGATYMASPLRADDLSKLPPATILTAEYDPLRDEGEAYAERLTQAGIATDLTRYDGVFHGFFQMPLDAGAAAVAKASSALRDAFGA